MCSINVEINSRVNHGTHDTGQADTKELCDRRSQSLQGMFSTETAFITFELSVQPSSSRIASMTEVPKYWGELQIIKVLFTVDHAGLNLRSFHAISLVANH
jgi:hypothetical protein